MKDEATVRLLLTSFSKDTSAQTALRTLLEEGLIACGTLIPGAQSLYHWQGRVEDSEECIVLLKTTKEMLSLCMDRIAQLHPYQVPEIIAVRPEAVSAPYADWVNEVLKIPKRTFEETQLGDSNQNQ